jgi:hypothetical protein
MIIEDRPYWSISRVVAVLAWTLLLVVTFLVAIGVVGLWSGPQLFSTAVFVIVGVVAGTLSMPRAASSSPQGSRRGR